MVKSPNPGTLFHLLPLNPLAHDALRHPDNKHLVSTSQDGQPGLEVGFHVRMMPNGRTLAELGRNAHLILLESTPENPMSRVHAAFEFNAATGLVLLSFKSSSTSPRSVAVRPSSSGDGGETVHGGSVIVYGTNYNLSIAAYNFRLVRSTLSSVHLDNHKLLEQLARRGYDSAVELMANFKSRDQLTEGDGKSRALSHTDSAIGTSTILTL
ncbi:hypothetical protein RB601_008708 [Gaeumannomyces tritici]